MFKKHQYTALMTPSFKISKHIWICFDTISYANTKEMANAYVKDEQTDL